MEKFIEVFGMARKVGWETEACYELERAAESSEGRMALVSNNGLFNKADAGTYEVAISMDATGDFRNHEGLTKEEADRIFESYL